MGVGTNGVFLDPATDRGLGVNDESDGRRKTYEERLNVEEGIIFETYDSAGGVKKKVILLILLLALRKSNQRIAVTKFS